MEDRVHKREMDDKEPRVASSMARVFEKRTKDCLKFGGGRGLVVRSLVMGVVAFGTHLR